MSDEQKELKDSLRKTIDISKKIYQESKTEQNLTNYLVVSRLVNLAYSLSKIISEQNKTLQKASNCIDDYRYLLKYIRQYVGEKYYSNMMYAANAAMQANKSKEKQTKEQFIRTGCDRL